MAGNANQGKGPISDINVTPLVDIMLVLVIILMITAEFTKYKTVPVALPKVNAAAVKQEPQKVTVSIRKDKSIYVNDKQATDMNDLIDRLRGAKSSYPDMAVIMRADSEIPYANVVAVLDQVKKAGIAKVGLAVDSKR